MTMARQTPETPLRLRRRTSRQSAALLGALGDVFTTREDGPRLSRQLGDALAAACPRPAGSDVAALEAAINEALADMDLGVARLLPQDDALVIEVAEYPAVNPSPRQPEVVVFGLLEGFLTRYLNTLSGSQDLSARLAATPAATDAPLRLLYRKHP